jgi:hypothetical protein
MDRTNLTYLKAEKRVKEIKSFYRLLFIMMAIACFLMALNFFTDPREFWSIYPILSMALVVSFRYLRVFGFPGFGKDWEEKQFYQELERIQEREERIRLMLNKEKTIAGFKNTPPAQAIASKEEAERLELKELQKQWRDTDLV